MESKKILIICNDKSPIDYNDFIKDPEDSENDEYEY